MPTSPRQHFYLHSRCCERRPTLGDRRGDACGASYLPLLRCRGPSGVFASSGRGSLPWIFEERREIVWTRTCPPLARRNSFSGLPIGRSMKQCSFGTILVAPVFSSSFPIENIRANYKSSAMSRLLRMLRKEEGR